MVQKLPICSILVSNALPCNYCPSSRVANLRLLEFKEKMFSLVAYPPASQVLFEGVLQHFALCSCDRDEHCGNYLHTVRRLPLCQSPKTCNHSSHLACMEPLMLLPSFFSAMWASIQRQRLLRRCAPSFSNLVSQILAVFHQRLGKTIFQCQSV